MKRRPRRRRILNAGVLRAIRRDRAARRAGDAHNFRPVEFVVPAAGLGGGGDHRLERRGGLGADGGGRAGFGRWRITDFGAMAFDSQRILIMKTFKSLLLVALVFLAGVVAGVVGTRIVVRQLSGRSLPILKPSRPASSATWRSGSGSTATSGRSCMQSCPTRTNS